MEVISRKAANAAGFKYYFTGKPCKRGHIDRRFVSSFWCMTCCRERARQEYRALDAGQRQAVYASKKDYLRRWAVENQDRKSEYGAAYRKRYKQTNPDYFSEYYARNKERKKQESRTWYHANTDKAYANRKEYVAANRDKARAWGRKSRAKRRATLSQVFVEAVDPRVVFDRDKGACGICGEIVEMSSQWEVDHIVPISKGGAHSYANVQLAHRKCNRAKGAKIA